MCLVQCEEWCRVILHHNSPAPDTRLLTSLIHVWWFKDNEWLRRSKMAIQSNRQTIAAHDLHYMCPLCPSLLFRSPANCRRKNIQLFRLLLWFFQHVYISAFSAWFVLKLVYGFILWLVRAITLNHTVYVQPENQYTELLSCWKLCRALDFLCGFCPASSLVYSLLIQC